MGAIAYGAGRGIDSVSDTRVSNCSTSRDSADGSNVDGRAAGGHDVSHTFGQGGGAEDAGVRRVKISRVATVQMATV